MTSGETIVLTIQIFVGKVMSLLFNMLSRFVKEQVSFNFMAQSLSTVILEPKKIKSATVSIVSPSISYEVLKPDAMIFVL